MTMSTIKGTRVNMALNMVVVAARKKRVSA